MMTLTLRWSWNIVIHPSVTEYRDTKNVGLDFNPSVVDRIEAELNVSFRVILRKGVVFKQLNDWWSPTYITSLSKSVVSLEDRIMTHDNFNIYMLSYN